jgi:outer membrane protein assembly factor BamB
MRVHAAPTVGPNISLYNNFGRPYSTFKVVGTAFGQSEVVTITFGTKVIGTATTTQAKFVQQVNVPGSAPPGNNTVTATGQTSGLTAQATFLVQTWWVMFGFDAQNSHYNSDENVINTTNVSQLVLNWSYTGVTNNTSPSTPIVRKDNVYFTTPNGKVTVLRPTGKVMWFQQIPTTISSIAPAVYYGVVYVGADDGNMYAFNYNTGALLWTQPTGGAIRSSTTIAGSAAYFGSMDGKVYALAAESPTGQVKWMYQTGGPITGTSAVSSGNVIVTSQDGNVYALNSKGTLLWTFNTSGPITSSPAVANGMVYVGSSDHTLYALNASTGALVWSYATGGVIASSPAVDRTNVYIGSQDNNLYALNAQTGVWKWSYTTGGAVNSTPAVANGIVYVGSDDNNLYAFNVKDGTKLWNYTTGGTVESSPVVSDGIVYIASSDGKIYGFHV